MTGEEKIALLVDELEDIRYYNFDADTDEDKTLKEAVRVIKSLEQESCEDAISRQAVLDAITANSIWENEYNLTSSRIKKAVESLPSVTPKQTRWIPVSERLPEERGVYIVTEKVFSLNDIGHKGRYNTKVEPVEYCNGKWQKASFFEVIAWMPLPEPYKAESEDKE